MMLDIVLVMVGGAIGSGVRYGFAVWAIQIWGMSFPWGIMGINILGSFVLGVLVALAGPLMPSPQIRLLLGTGFCGGFTTFSTFSVDTFLLLERQEFGLALVYILGNVGGGLLAAWLGFRLGQQFI
jgi:fluoride exporter